MTNPPVQWPIPQVLLDSPAVTNRDLLAQTWSSRPTDAILKQYIKMDSREALEFYGQIFDLFPALALEGVGLELGAGVAAFSSVAVTRFPAIRSIYAVELVPDVVRLLQMKTVRHMAGVRSDCIHPVIGSFDDVELPDESVDFCIEFASLHHSDDLHFTLSELARVLKPGGVLLAVDRAHHDRLLDEQVEFMLDVEYSEVWKRDNGYSSDVLTRRTNGEHEHRLSFWEETFGSCGFDMITRRELRLPGLRPFCRALLLSLPFSLRRVLGILPSRVRPQRGELRWRMLGLFGLDFQSTYAPAAHEYTVFVVRRRA